MKKVTESVRNKNAPDKKVAAIGKNTLKINSVARKYIDNTIKKNADVWKELAKH